MSSLIQGEATEADIRPLAAGAEHGADYLVLRRRVRLAGNDAIALATFDQLYAPMRAQGEGQPDRTILFARGEASGTPCIRAVADGLRWHFGPDWVEWPCAAFTTMLLGGCGEFFPIHAGCVARGGRAVIVCGRSGLGKTTLVSHLAAQGWDLLSDEISPIARDTALVDPYPVRVGLRTGPGRALIRGDDYEVLTTPRDEKHLVDVGALSGRPAPEPAKLAAVVILSRRLDAAVVTASKLREPVHAVFAAWSPGLEAGLRGLPTLAGLETASRGDGTLVRLRLADAQGLIDRLRELARIHQTTLLEAHLENFGASDFGAEAELAPIPATTGVLELMKNTPASVRQRLIEREYSGRTARFLDRLAATVAHAQFFKLRPGRLESEVRLIESILP